MDAKFAAQNLLEPYKKFSALLAKKIYYLRLLSSSAGSG
jgi:hypothetical protein